MRVLRAVPLLLLVACTEHKVELFGSGSRLRARGLKSGDTTVFQTMFDTTLGEPCSFVRDGEGVLRCFPNVLPPIQAYADAACTRPVTTHPGPGCAVGKLVSVPVSVDCEGGRHALFRVTAERTAQLFGGRPGACGPTTQEHAVELAPVDAADVAPSSLVKGTVVPGGPSPAGVEFIRADDGSFTTRGLYSHPAKSACVPTNAGTLSDGGLRQVCAARPAWDFGDHVEKQACNQSLAYYPQSDRTCAGPLTVLGFIRGANFNYQLDDFFSPGVEVDASEAAFGDKTTATCSTGEVTSRVFRRGARIEAPPALVTAFVGTGSVRPPFFTTPSGQPLSPQNGDWLDSNDAGCFPYETADAGVRCVRAGSAPYFLDAACTTRVTAGTLPDDVTIVYDENLCTTSRLATAHRRGALVSPAPTEVFIDIPSGCASTQAPGPIFRLGEVVPWTNFPAIEQVE